MQGAGLILYAKDYAKAFDSVVHSKLIAKLELYGTHPIMLLWINSDRTHKVRVGSSLSDVVTVISGVPHGSVLGPVLFIVFINDICSCTPVGVTLKLYADDAKLYIFCFNM